MSDSLAQRYATRMWQEIFPVEPELIGENRYIGRDADGAYWLCRRESVLWERLREPGPAANMPDAPRYVIVLMPVFGPVTKPLVHHPYARFFDPLFTARAA